MSSNWTATVWQYQANVTDYTRNGLHCEVNSTSDVYSYCDSAKLMIV